MKIDLKNIQLKYDNNEIFNDFSYHFDDNGLYVLRGPSGCGKSSLLKVLYLALKPINGMVYYDGKDVTSFTEKQKDDFYGKKIFYYNEDYNLIDFLTVKENLDLYKKEIDYIDILKTFNVYELINNKVSTLSKGEKARVSIIKAILMNCETILLDEPFAYIDPEQKEIIYKYILDYSKNHCVILVLHDAEMKIDGYKEILDFNNNLKTRKSSIEPIIENDSKETIETKKSKLSLKLAEKFIFKKKGRFIFSIIFLFLSIMILVPSLNFLFYSNRAIFSDSVSGAQVTFAETIKYSDNLENFDDKESLTKSCTFQIVEVNSSLSMRQVQLMIALEDEFVLNGTKYTFEKQAGEYAVLANSATGLAVGDKISGNFFNLFSFASNKDFYVKDVLSEFGRTNPTILINKETFLELINDKIFRIDEYGVFDDIFSAIETTSTTFISASNLLSTYKIKDDQRSILSNNDVNFCISKNKYDNFLSNHGETFENYYSRVLENKTFTSTNNPDLYVKSFLNEATIKGFMVVDLSSYGNGSSFDYGIELSDKVTEKMIDNFYTNSFCFPKNEEKLTIFKDSIINPFIYDLNNIKSFNFYNNSGEVNGDILNPLNTKNQYGPLLLGFGLVLLAVYLISMIFLNINLFKVNYRNIYVLKKDGFGTNNFIRSFCITNGIVGLIAFAIGALVGNLISFIVSKIVIDNFNFPSYIYIFKNSVWTYLVVLAVLVITFVLTYVFYSNKYKNKTINDYDK